MLVLQESADRESILTFKQFEEFARSIKDNIYEYSVTGQLRIDDRTKKGKYCFNFNGTYIAFGRRGDRWEIIFHENNIKRITAFESFSSKSLHVEMQNGQSLNVFYHSANTQG